VNAAALLGLAVVAVFAAVLFVPRLPRASRVRREAGTAAVSPQRPPAAGGMAVPAAAVQPRGEATRPFACDNGLIIGDESP
jgi:hypothetical protein